MNLLHVFGFGLRVGHLLWTLCRWIIIHVVSLNLCHSHHVSNNTKNTKSKNSPTTTAMESFRRIPGSVFRVQSRTGIWIGAMKKMRKSSWWRKLLWGWIVLWIVVALWILYGMSSSATEKRKETLASMCDERARMLQEQFNVSMNHVQAMSILISTFHHGKNPSAIDQRTFARYTERTAFERPLTSGVAYAVRVLHSEREQFERQQGWTIKMMYSLEKEDHRSGGENDHSAPEAGEPSPIQDEYAPVIFAQDTVAHVVSLDMLSGEEDRENVLRARASGKGVLTAPFPLLKTNRLGVILTFAVYKRDLPSNATPNERIQATDGYLGGIFDIESLVENLLQQLASKQTILVNVYDTTNHSDPMLMYGSNVSDDGLRHVSGLNFGDPHRSHEMRCRFKVKTPWPWLAMATSFVTLVIALLLGYIFHATVNHIAKVEDDYHEMMELKKRAEAADVAKSQFLATVSHEIRTPMNGVLGMLHMLMDTELDVNQLDFVRTAQGSGKALVSLINEVLDQAKIESGKLELEEVRFDLRAILDDVLSLFSGKSQEKGVELAVFISDQVPEMLIGDPGRFRQIITNLMGNSIKFTEKGHIFVTIHLVEELINSIDVETTETSSTSKNTLSGFPVADKCQSWKGFHAIKPAFSSTNQINLIVCVEDTGVGIPLEAQPRIFTPFMQVGPSISRTHGGTGIGLSISKCLVNLMRGEIGFASVPKVGSTFTFTAVFERTAGPASKPSPELRGMSALVVDPRPIRRKVSRYHMERLGIRVEAVSDPSQCQSLLATSASFDMVLVEKEVWDGEPSFLGPHAPKVFVLANSGCTSSLSPRSAGHSVIMKPLRASMLAASLQRAMGVGSKNPRNGDAAAAALLPAMSLRHLLRGRRILVIDDNAVNLKVAAGALKKYGAEVVCEDSGFKAVKLLAPPHLFDACFMDIQMPGMDGFEATKRIREREREMKGGVRWHVPILAMTADVIQATQEECSKCGMDGYVSKPFEAEQLYREVSRFFLFSPASAT